MSVLHACPTAVPLAERLYTKDNTQMEEYRLRELENHISYPISTTHKKHEGGSWQRSYPQASMSDHKRHGAYDVPPSEVADVYQARPEINHGLPREQLPPLSSILGGSRPSIHSRSSYGNQSPAFSSPSPHDGRQMSGPALQEQQAWEAYSQRRPPQVVSSPYPYDTRVGQSLSSELPQPPLRPMQISQGSNSPQFYGSRYSPKDSPRTQLPLSRSGWSPRSEAPYREYFPTASRDTSSSFRPQLDQHHPMAPPLQRKESDHEQPYNEAYRSIPSTQQYPASPATSVTSDSVASKDSLGPKIWTGTQFLPRFVRQAEVPGEGLCYFYDDGTHCKTHIDGEAVNAHWGVTKAGKPRKRLAIACITCREKKIKCDPDYPRCTQCEKFGRVCKFKNAPRGGQGSPEISPEADESLLRPVSQLPNGGIPRLEKREVPHGASLRSSYRQPSVESDDNPAKRAKYSHIPPMPSNNQPESRAINAFLEQEPPSTTGKPSGDIMNRWNTNPFDIEEDLVNELMRVYFIHKGISGAHGMLPKKPFMLWLTNRCFQKSPDDLMLIYTMLALATVFSSNPVHKKRGDEFAAISRHACDERHYSLQLVQSRLLLALYYYAKNNVADSWDFCGAAIRTATGMKLNLEIEEAKEKDRNELPYNLNRAGYTECRRRTFWTCFILDRLNGYCSGQLSIINPADVFLRLPSDDNSFEEQVEVRNPYFDISAQVPESLSSIGSMAYLIGITSIWGDIMANIYRTSHRPSSDEEGFNKFASFYSDTTSRLETWLSSLPDSLSYSPENLTNAANSGTLNIFITLHTLYHSAQMRLNRHLQPDIVPSEQLEHYIRTTHSHAEAVLGMADKLAACLFQPSNNSAPVEISIPFSAPFIGYAIVNAIDVVTAKGYRAELELLSSKIRSSMAIITDLAKYWHSAKNQRELLIARKTELITGPTDWKGFSGTRDFAVVNTDAEYGDEGREGDGAGPDMEARKYKLRDRTYEMKVPIGQTLVRDHDCIYAVDIETWDKALTNNVA